MVPSGNLLLNPGAEAGPGATSSTGKTAIPFWTTFGAAAPGGNFTAVEYGTEDLPSSGVAGSIGGGSNFFAGGDGESSSGARQDIDVVIATPDIDERRVSATLAAHIGGYAATADDAVVQASYLGASGASLGTLSIGPVTSADRNGQTTLLRRNADGPVPSGTRAIRVTITATRKAGTYNDGYADNVSLSLTRGEPRPLPPPVLGRLVNLAPLAGQILVRIPGGSGFTDLTDLRQVPVRSLIDATNGLVELTSATTRAGVTQTGRFTEGRFQVRQSTSPKQRGLTELRLSGGDFKACRASKSGGPVTAAARRKSRRVVRRLRSNAKGRFRTRGRYSAAAVRGTQWLTADRCDGTLTRVTSGRVAVRDFRRKRTIILRAGQSYLAKAP